MSRCCLFENDQDELSNYTTEGIVRALTEERDEAAKEFDFFQQKIALLNQVIEKLK